MAFLTGSRAYGMPTANSDIDLAVLVDLGDCMKLIEMADCSKQCYGTSASLRFGKLNLVTFCEEEEYDAWRAATGQLKSIQPVTKDIAIETIEGQAVAARMRRRNWGYQTFGVAIMSMFVGYILALLV